MTTSLREAVERVEAWARIIERPAPDGDNSLKVAASVAEQHAADLRTLLSALQEAREALTQISVGPLFVATDVNAWAEYATNLARETLGLDTEARALSPGGAEQ